MKEEVLSESKEKPSECTEMAKEANGEKGQDVEGQSGGGWGGGRGLRKGAWLGDEIIGDESVAQCPPVHLSTHKPRVALPPSLPPSLPPL